jgi:glyoxylase I family protein
MTGTFDLRGMVPLISVFHMPTSLHFYRDLLGFEVVQTADPAQGDDVGWCMLRRGNIDLMLNTAYDPEDQPDHPDAARFESHHDTCLYFGCPDVDAMYTHLRDRLPKVNPPEIAYYGMKQLYVHDPDGYNVCFQWPAR